NVEVTIYNELGAVVSYEQYSFGPGNHTIAFDGNAWASGNYFAQVKAGEQLQTKRMTLLK
ncbi:MAG: T9SS type A sorting domain-containing protein, partial [bacterium]